MIKVSDGNSKIGKVKNINMPALVTCPMQAKCREFCYACKGTYRFKSVVERYKENLESFIVQSLEESIEQITGQLKGKRDLIRWHASGDIVNEEYFEMMVKVAESRQDKRFLAFTKKYDIVNAFKGSIPENLTIVFSADENLEMVNPHNFPVAIVSDTETTCGNQTHGLTCDQCKKCWNLKHGKTITFSKH